MFPFSTDMLMNTFTDYPSVIQPVDIAEIVGRHGHEAMVKLE